MASTYQPRTRLDRGEGIGDWVEPAATRIPKIRGEACTEVEAEGTENRNTATEMKDLTAIG